MRVSREPGSIRHSWPSCGEVAQIEPAPTATPARKSLPTRIVSTDAVRARVDPDDESVRSKERNHTPSGAGGKRALHHAGVDRRDAPPGPRIETRHRRVGVDRPDRPGPDRDLRVALARGLPVAPPDLLRQRLRVRDRGRAWIDARDADGVVPVGPAGVADPQRAGTGGEIAGPPAGPDRPDDPPAAQVVAGDRVVFATERPHRALADGEGSRSRRKLREGAHAPARGIDHREPSAGRRRRRRVAAAAERDDGSATGRERRGREDDDAPPPPRAPSRPRVARLGAALGTCTGAVHSRVMRPVAGTPRQVELPILQEDRPLEALELDARLQSELPRQLVPGRPVGAQGLRLTSGPVEREHELPPQALTEGMVGDQDLQLADEIRMATGGEIGVDALLERDEAQLLKSGDLRLQPPLVDQVGQRWAAPQCERLVQLARRRDRVGQARLAAQPLKVRKVELGRTDAQDVPRRPRVEPVRAQLRAQPRDIGLDALRGRRRRRLLPQVGEQAIGRDDLAGVQDQNREQRPLFDPSEGKRALAVDDLQRAEDAEVHLTADRTGADRAPLARIVHHRIAAATVEAAELLACGSPVSLRERHRPLDRRVQPAPATRRNGQTLYWTEKRIRTELTTLCAGRTVLPSRRELQRAGLAGMLCALQRRHGADWWARELGLPRYRRGSGLATP